MPSLEDRRSCIRVMRLGQRNRTISLSSSVSLQFKDECRFSAGAKNMFWEGQASGVTVLHSGDYEATAFRATARTIIPLIDSHQTSHTACTPLFLA